MLDVIKAALYSSAVLLLGLINIFLMIPVKYKLMPFTGWIKVEKVVFYLAALILYWLFALAGLKTHKISGWKAYLAAAVPFVLLVLINIVFSGKILPKFAGILG